MLSYGGKKKKYIHTHTHTHTCHPSSRHLSVSLHQMSQILCTIYHYFITIHSSAILKTEFLSVCMCLSFHYNISQGNNAFHQSRPFPSSSFYLSSQQENMVDGPSLPWACPASSLPNSLLPHFPSCNCPDTQRILYNSVYKLLAETTC